MRIVRRGHILRRWLVLVRIVQRGQVPRLYGSDLMCIVRDMHIGDLPYRMWGIQWWHMRNLSVRQVQDDARIVEYNVRIVRLVQLRICQERMRGRQQWILFGRRRV